MSGCLEKDKKNEVLPLMEDYKCLGGENPDLKNLTSRPK